MYYYIVVYIIIVLYKLNLICFETLKLSTYNIYLDLLYK